MAWFTIIHLFSLFFLIVGFIMIFRFLRDFVRSNKAKAWLTTQGTVVESWVEKPKITYEESAKHYFPGVRYRYQVARSEYQGTQIALGTQSGRTENEALEIIGKYPPNGNVTVYYNPKQPSEAVLEHNISKTSLIYGVVFIVVGTFGIF